MTDPRPARTELSKWIETYAEEFADADELVVRVHARPKEAWSAGDDAAMPRPNTCHPRTINLFIKYGVDPGPARTETHTIAENEEE